MNKPESVIMRFLVYLSVCFFWKRRRSLIIYLEKKSPEMNGESDLGVCVLCSSSQIMSLFMYVCVFSLCVFSTTSKRLDVVLLFCFFFCHKACVCACFFSLFYFVCVRVKTFMYEKKTRKN
jgi:hypothetical protein